MSDLCFLSALELRERFRSREISPVEALTAVLDRIERINPALNAFVTLVPEEALEQARRAEHELTRRDREELGALHGIPVAIKDLTPTAGIRTTFGSVNFADHVPDSSALAWDRIRAAGAILVGKTTTPDFGLLGVTQSTLTGTTNNPWNVERTAGGSSGGSAVAAAAGLAYLTWGSDGGGSIRVPAACCGVVGLKGSPGRMPAWGEGPQLYETVATVGPLTRTVADCALLLSVTAGPDPRDPIALPDSGEDWLAAASSGSLDGVRIACSADLGQATVSQESQRLFTDALDVLRDLGATVEPVALELPDTLDYFLAWWGPGFVDAYDQAMSAGAAPDSFPPATRDLVQRARDVTFAQARAAAAQLRPALGRALSDVLSRHDFLVCPTMPLTAFPHPGAAGGNTHVDGAPVRIPSLDFHRLTEPFSHAGLPALTVPCGFDRDGLPAGLQIVGGFRDDAGVLRVGAAYEAATHWSNRRPDSSSEMQGARA
jgi:Asp-tRNA(Asn)/Glu-tRNA(Gln) amidotransferase A subunit family amidase